MKRAFVFAAVCLLSSAAMAASVFTDEEAAALQAGLTVTADEFILPAYERHADATQGLTDALDGYCEGSARLAAAHAAFADTFTAWQYVSIIQFGPVGQAEGPMRVQIWPDPKGFAARAVRQAVNAADDKLLEPGAIEGRSIALTGLGALEYLLYGNLQPNTYACDLATAISMFQADMAAEWVVDWSVGSAFRADYDDAASGNLAFENVDALMRQFLSGGVVYVDRLRKFKLLRGLGTDAGKARPERTEARASGQGLASIREGFIALAAMYDVPFGVFDAGADIGGSAEYIILAQTAASLADTISVMDGTLDEIAAEDGAAAADLRRMADLVLQHERLLKSGFAQSIGLSAGFTAADGD